MHIYSSFIKKYLTVFLCIVFLLFIPSTYIYGASIYLEPNFGDVGSGDTFIINVRVDAQNECVNAFDIKIRYPVELFKIVDVSKGGSILTLWTEEPSIKISDGALSFSGGLPGGYCGRIAGDTSLSNILAKIIVDVPASVRDNDEVAIGTIEFDSDTAVYVNDGNGTLAKVQKSSAVFNVHPESPNPKNEWLDTLTKDDVPPEPFLIQVISDKKILGPRLYAIFTAIDKMSGIDYFEVYERFTWRRVKSPYALPEGKVPSELFIRAVDKTGNIRLGTYSLPTLKVSPMQWNHIITALFLIILVMGGVSKIYLAKKNKKNKKNRNILR